MPPTRKRRILCVADDEDTRELLTHFLEHKGYEVKTAASIDEALKASSGAPFDLYFLADRLPDGSGVDLCRRLREFDPHTPIIVYSGAVFKSDEEAALQAGASAFVPGHIFKN